LANKLKKNGAPNKAVNIPTGTSAGMATVLAKVSANSKSKAPSNIDKGNTWR
jgi:hypothetical protein